MSAMAEQVRFTEAYPEIGDGPIPTEPYFSEEYFKQEQKYVFGRAWIHLGRVEEIPNPGDYFVKDLEAPKASVLVVRDKDGQVRAFHNVCTHRCNRLVINSCGKGARRFNCTFHGWSFDTQGKLAGVPEKDTFTKFDQSELGLTPVACDTWEGFIFVCFADPPQESLEDFLGDHFAQLKGYPFHRLQACFGWQAVVKCNWKVALDAFQEAYHVPYVHGHSIADALRGATEGPPFRPLTAVLNGYHRKLSIGGNPKSVYGNPKAVTEGAAPAMDNPTKPIESAALRLGRGGTKERFEASDLPRGMNPSKHPNWAFDINGVFPDFYLSLRPNYYQAYNFRPLSADETLFDARVYYPKQENAGGRFYQEYMKNVLRDVLLEDWATLERLYDAMKSGARKTMVYSENEIALRHSFHVIDGFVQRKGAPPTREGRV